MLKQATLHFSRAPNLPFVDPTDEFSSSETGNDGAWDSGRQAEGHPQGQSGKRRSACGGGGAILADGQSLLLLWRHTFSRRCSVGIF